MVDNKKSEHVQLVTTAILVIEFQSFLTAWLSTYIKLWSCVSKMSLLNQK